MCVWAADDIEIQHARQLDIIHVSALFSDKTRVFLALHGVPHAADFRRCSERHHASLCRIFSAAYWTALTILTYPVQRHRLPEIAQRISSSLGAGLCCKRA